MMFGKMQIFFSEHSNACQKCRKVLVYNEKLWKRAIMHSPNFWAASKKYTSKEHICHVELRFKKNKHSLTIKKLKKIEFSQ